MAHRAPHDHRGVLRLAVHTRRTRVIVAMIGAVLGVATPVAVWGTPGLTVDGHPTRPPDDPAGLGITGALPGDPFPGLPGDPLPGDPLPGDLVPGELLPGFPPRPDLPDGPLGIPGVVLEAYQRAEQTLASAQPGCRLSWSVLAGIGRIESGHARGGRLDPTGTTLGPILGPALDGSPGVAAIPDTDRGALDQDQIWDRAVGPMQFIPTSWRSFGVDADHDGQASPHNIHDATTAAGRYLCSAGGDLSDPDQLQTAVFRYNHSATYVATVLRWAQAYLSGVTPTPPAAGPIPPATNGNGGPPIPADIAPQAVAPMAAVVQPGPPVAPPPPAAPLPATTPTTTPPITATPPPVTTTPPPVTTTSPPVTTPSPPVTTTPPVVTSPPATTTPPPVVTLPPPPATPPPPPTDSTPLPSPPPTTTTPSVEPASDPPPPPPLAAL